MWEIILQALGIGMVLYLLPYVLGKRWRLGTLDAERERIEDINNVLQEVVSQKQDEGEDVEIKINKEERAKEWASWNYRDDEGIGKENWNWRVIEEENSHE